MVAKVNLDVVQVTDQDRRDFEKIALSIGQDGIIANIPQPAPLGKLRLSNGKLVPFKPITECL